MTKRNTQAGFSLVELAIVLLIIGLIVGGVLKGQDLIRSARVNDVQTTLNEVRAATNTFQDKYVALPGDIARAEIVDSDLDDTDGNGNGRIEDLDDVTWGNDDENSQFWAHLAGAGLISGVDADAAADGIGNNGEDALEASIGGFYSIGYFDPADSLANIEARRGHWFRLAENADAEDVDGEAVLTPVDLRSIDMKADDGEPDSGDVLGAGNECNVDDGNGGRDYGTGENVTCHAYFRL